MLQSRSGVRYRENVRGLFSLTLILFLFVWVFTALDTERDSKIGFWAGLKAPDFLIKRYLTTSGITPDEMQFLAENPTIQAQLEEIDRQIKELEAMKRGFEARALRHDDQAQRLQFEDRAVLETRRHYELAEENRAKADKVQQEIDRLNAERRKLLHTEGIAKLHSEPNLRFFRWVRFFAKCLWPTGYVTLQKIEPAKKSLNFAREASFAIPSNL